MEASVLRDYLFDVIKAILAEGVGFLVLAVIGGYILRQKIIHAIDAGFLRIGNATADSIFNSFKIHILPELVRLREAAEEQFPRPGEKVGKRDEEVPTTAEIDESLKSIERIIGEGRFQQAEKNLLLLRSQHPKDFRVLDSLFSLYRNPRYQKKADALEILLRAEEDFKADKRFYNRLAHAYMELKGILSDYHVRKNALDSAEKCIAMQPTDPNGHKLFGLVHFVFNELDKAIEITEKALTMAQDQKDKAIEISCKNNLAFYYAATEKGEFRDKAIGYAKEAIGFNPASAFYYDTLGYVLMVFGKTKQDLDEAIRLFNKALELDPFDPDILHHLQEAYSKAKGLLPAAKG